MKNSLTALCLLAMSCTAAAADIRVAEKQVTDNPVNTAQINAAFAKMEATVRQISPSPIAGVALVSTSSGVFYISNDGSYLLQGPMFDMRGDAPQNITNLAFLDELESLKNEMIIYKSMRGNRVITVFTNTGCSYCRQLHNEVKELNNKGITVRYLAYPTFGKNDRSWRQMQSVWCSGFKTNALNSAFKGETVPEIEQCNVDLNKHAEMGQKFGITGTPGIILDNGRIIAGYTSADKIAEALENK